MTPSYPGSGWVFLGFSRAEGALGTTSWRHRTLGPDPPRLEGLSLGDTGGPGPWSTRVVGRGSRGGATGRSVPVPVRNGVSTRPFRLLRGPYPRDVSDAPIPVAPESLVLPWLPPDTGPKVRDPAGGRRRVRLRGRSRGSESWHPPRVPVRPGGKVSTLRESCGAQTTPSGVPPTFGRHLRCTPGSRTAGTTSGATWSGWGSAGTRGLGRSCRRRSRRSSWSSSSTWGWESSGTSGVTDRGGPGGGEPGPSRRGLCPVLALPSPG